METKRLTPRKTAKSSTRHCLGYWWNPRKKFSLPSRALDHPKKRLNKDILQLLVMKLFLTEDPSLSLTPQTPKPAEGSNGSDFPLLSIQALLLPSQKELFHRIWKYLNEWLIMSHNFLTLFTMEKDVICGDLANFTETISVNYQPFPLLTAKIIRLK